MMKKLLSCILIISMLASMLAFSVIAEETAVEAEEVSKYALEIGFLTKLGLLDEDFDLKANVTKAEMAKHIATILHPEMDFSQALPGQAFSDVPESHEFHSYIKLCKDLGVVKGDYENNFYPDNQVTAIEAITMMINALGYTPYAEAFGGYPTGYFQVASNTGISKGVALASTDPATGEVVAKIMYNALFADIVKLGAISNGSIEIVVNNGKNILSERLGIYEYDAIVTDNGIGSLYGNSVGDPEKAVIRDIKTNKNITAYVGDTKVGEYLGYRVKAFVRNNADTGRNEFVYVAPHAAFESVTVNAKYIFNVTNDYVEYDEDIETADYEKIALGGVTPVILVNGARIAHIDNQTSEPLLKQVMPKDGFVTFIENTGDSFYDIVNVTSFNYYAGMFNFDARNIVVETVIDTEDETSISCSYNPSQSLDLTKGKADYAFVGNEDIESIDDLDEGMIISIAECPSLVKGNPYYYLYVCEDTVDGTLVAKSGDTLVLGDDSEYDFSSSLKSNFVNLLQMGKEVTLYLDVTGKIAYAEGESGASKNYAYIVKAVRRTYAGSDTVLVKIFTKDGEMKELKLASKCKIDGIWYDTAAKQEAAINGRSSAASKMEGDVTTGRPAIVDVNSDDLITRIDTDNPNIDLGYSSASTYADAFPIEKSEFYSIQQPIPYSEEDASSFETLKAGFRNPKASAMYNKNCLTSEGRFFINSKTFIINAAEIDTYALSSDIYSRYSPAYDTGAHNYQVFPNHSITEIQSNEGDEDEYAILKSTNIATSRLYDLQGYDIDPDTGVAGLVVIRGRTLTATPTTSTPLVVYSRRTMVYDEKLEKSVAKLYYFGTSGKEESVLYDPELLTETYTKLVDNHLRTGDIIRVVKDADGYLSYVDRFESIERLIAGTTYTSKTAIEVTDGIADATKSSYFSYSGNTTTVGYANKVNGSVAEMLVGGANIKLATLTQAAVMSPIPANRRYYADFMKIKPLVINFNANGEISVKVGTLNDIVSIKDATDANGNVDMNKASIIVYRQTRFVPALAFVINGLDVSAHFQSNN